MKEVFAYIRNCDRNGLGISEAISYCADKLGLTRNYVKNCLISLCRFGLVSFKDYKCKPLLRPYLSLVLQCVKKGLSITETAVAVAQSSEVGYHHIRIGLSGLRVFKIVTFNRGKEILKEPRNKAEEYLVLPSKEPEPRENPPIDPSDILKVKKLIAKEQCRASNKTPSEEKFKSGRNIALDACDVSASIINS